MTARFEVFEDKFEGEKVAMSRTRFICLLLFFFLPTLASAVEPWAFLEFPTLFGDTITIRDGSNLTLPFRISVTGSPPDLVLSVYLTNVNEADDGMWRLELTNDAGTGQADFRLYAPPGVEVSQDMASNQSADLYMEVLDEAVRTVEAPPRPCQRRRLHSRPPQAAAPPSETKDPHPDRNPNLWYISSSIEGLSSSNKHKTKNAAENVAEASSSAADIASSDGYLTPRPLRNRTEDAAGGATTMLPRSDTGLPADYLTPASRQQGAEATYPENVALLPMRSETSPGASSLTPLSLPEETKNINITAVET
ncbi:hypothetical protein BaRGS_00003658 [Batillaria attramentaria]|uniref:Uncharacterized protein n=1 Tax=Batillaria attramentaria TaxID=370345 RepID=A0ABD0M052_9CAEN